MSQALAWVLLYAAVVNRKHPLAKSYIFIRRDPGWPLPGDPQGGDSGRQWHQGVVR